MRHACPRCRHELKPSTEWKMSGLVRCRPVVPCPDCGTPLRWSGSAITANIGAAFTVFFTAVAGLDPYPRQYLFLAVAAAAISLAEIAKLRVQGLRTWSHASTWLTAQHR